MTQTASEAVGTNIVIGPRDRKRIETCVSRANAHPRRLGDVFDEQHVVSFDSGIWAMYNVDLMGGGKAARHLTVSIADPSTGRPIVPDRPTVRMLARAFGFEEPTLGTTGANALVMHAVEVIQMQR